MWNRNSSYRRLLALSFRRGQRVFPHGKDRVFLLILAWFDIPLSGFLQDELTR